MRFVFYSQTRIYLCYYLLQGSEQSPVDIEFD